MFMLAGTLLLGMGVAMILGIRALASSTAWVEHTYQVMSTIDAVDATLRSAESSARAYRLTNRPEQQAEYLAVAPLTLEHSSRLLALTRDNPEQQQRAALLQQQVEARLAEIAGLVELQREHGADRARAATLSGEGVELMHRVAATENEMRRVEQTLLDQRSSKSQSDARLLTVLVVLGILTPAALVTWLMASLLAETRRSRALEREAHRAMRELQASAVLRDRLSEQRRSLGVYAGLLQTCQNVEEAMTITAGVIAELLPAAGGRCYSLRPSQDLAETSARFGLGAIESAELLQPSQCWGLRRGQPHRTDALHGHVRCAHMDPQADMSGVWTLCVPLMAQGTSLGLLHVSARERDSIDDNHADILEAVAEQLSLAMVNLQLRETLRTQSLRDALTGLFNRRYLEENLNRELQRCERRGLPLSVLMIDVDHFKRFNDQHGHAAGDMMLASIGKTLQSMTREEDIACRYGGEEFTIVLPEMDADSALRRAEEIRAALATTRVTHMRRVLGPSTASIGIATFPRDGDAPARLMEVADAALYRAKAEGRDRVVNA
ncbi:MAG: diguanylate cyclase [Pseudomonadota bacterium]|nr:diguanylate cyclase [Pseudomonadota bacterium]